MKLRNKKTGEIAMVEFLADYQNDDGTEIGFRVKNTLDCYSYPSLAELNAEWEDYKEPLIKDEKIRKAVKAWADGNDVINVQFDAFWRGFRHNDSTITVWEDLPLEDNKIYSIAELCGEEEE